eukprot:m.371259 g.371259  ORF g.371259 m.371259 type:complete len:52 (+) comp58018_c0_seq1:111-266(+)
MQQKRSFVVPYGSQEKSKGSKEVKPILCSGSFQQRSCDVNASVIVPASFGF